MNELLTRLFIPRARTKQGLKERNFEFQSLLAIDTTLFHVVVMFLRTPFPLCRRPLQLFTIPLIDD